MTSIIKIIILNIKNGVMNIFTCLTGAETRGIGGIFFDYKKNNWEKDFSFVRECRFMFFRLCKK